ncbi:LysM peptidoglycan-binding domain-containing protein [Chitinispirillales bacterium ANBcel5]|uniref:LysM peptidoglycan-binding domain-containing protein n=1 Tax=Cellulosispirillum alkaliphilum TaxID=3039283 RepID=UPI002A54087F|nr:LysM peptidoglycan-binding domain-containing protein [Chitinispirillales bacterium ANBcel5]
MNKHHRKVGLLMFSLFLFTLASAEEELFPVPEVLEPNVAFWKKVYSEVSTKQGLLHDRNNLAIIYDIVETSSPDDVEAVRERRKELEASFAIIQGKPESSWGDQERMIVELFEKHGSRDDLKGAANRIRFQRGQKERFISGIERSGMFLDTIRTILKAYDLPLELAYLPHVESSFDTEAYSKVGAAGLWQFMRATGATFGMNIDYTIDERRDPIIATVGAARYLSNAYRILQAWPVAITSYNHGVNGMRRAVSQTGTNDFSVIVQNYRSRTFGFASSNFYASFLAAVELAENYQEYFPGVELMPKREFRSVTLDQYIRLDALISHLDIPIQEFRTLNPAIRPSGYNQQIHIPKGFTIHLPVSKTEQQIQTALVSIPDSLRSDQPLRPQYYRVRRGDNLNRIAARHGVTVRELARFNNITSINRIFAGQLLRIPPKYSPPTTVASATTETKPEEPEKPKKEPEEVSDSLQIASEMDEGPEIVPTTQKSEPTTHRVRVGENLNRIASRYGVTVRELARENNITQLNRIYPGQVLRVPGQVREEPEAVTHATEETEAVSDTLEKDTEEVTSEDKLSDTLRGIAASIAIIPDKTTSTIPTAFDVDDYQLDAVLSATGEYASVRVTLNETIGHYADWLGVSASDIRRLNNMGANSQISYNSTIRIPVSESNTLEEFAAARLEYHIAIEEDFFNRFDVVNFKERIVKRGENIWDIAKENDHPIPLWLIKKYNKDFYPSILIPGMVIQIPVVSEKE